MERLNIGDVVKHFKRETVGAEKVAKDKNIYLYKILGFATDSETRKKVVVYQALYKSDDGFVDYNMWTRDYDIFMSEVDHVKYPNIKQVYRFEKIV